MTNNSSISFTLRVLIALAALGLALNFMRISADYVISFLMAWIITLVFSPLLHWLKNKGISNGLSFVITTVVLISVFVALGLALIIGANRLAEEIPKYTQDFDNLIVSFDELFEYTSVEQLVEPIIDFVDPQGILESILKFITGLIRSFSSIILVLFLVVFLLLEAFNAPEKLAEEIQSGNTYLQRYLDISHNLRKYFLISTYTGLVTGTLDTIFFIIMGVPFPVLWGILAFFLAYIPTLGFWLAAIPPTLLTLLEQGLTEAVIVFLGIVLINGFSDNVVKPKMMGQGLALTYFMIIFSVVFWAAVLGPLGAIFGVPLTILFKDLVLEADDQNRWIAKLMRFRRSKEVATGTDAEISQVADE